MEFIQETNRLILYNDKKEILAEVTYPSIDSETVEINHTFVDQSLRGQGVAGRMMEAAAKKLRAEKKKAVLSCSYAVKWFQAHEEFRDVVK